MNKDLLALFTPDQIERYELQGGTIAQILLKVCNRLAEIHEEMAPLIPEEAQIIGKVKALKSEKSYLTTIANILTKELKYLDVK